MIQMVHVSLLLLLFVCAATTEQWDYITFTQAWPPTFCRAGNKCEYPAQLVNSWNIHGSWPSNSTGKDPEDCDSRLPFNINLLKPIYNELQVQWANLLNFDNPNEFWKHEWTKHGTCSLDDPKFPNELSYFANSLHLKNVTALERIFADNQIVPSDDQTYNTATITAAIRNRLGVTPKLECVDIDGQWFLDEIEICFNRNLEPINCPRHRLQYHDGLLKDTIKEIFNEIIEYFYRMNRGDSFRPVNQACGTHEFFLPTQSGI